MNIHDEESAADLPQTLHHTERVCGKSAASLRQTCRRLFIILKEYAASLRQVCGKTNLHVKKMTVCCRSAADLRQVCRRSMRQAHFFPMGLFMHINLENNSQMITQSMIFTCILSKYM